MPRGLSWLMTVLHKTVMTTDYTDAASLIQVTPTCTD
jgi:hypothetical protein